jgi:hypothetical protein
VRGFYVKGARSRVIVAGATPGGLGAIDLLGTGYQEIIEGNHDRRIGD